METMVDIVVIGGGPSGSATALALSRQGYSVAVIERSAYKTRRVGETLPPAIQSQLVGLGVWQRFLEDGHAAAYGVSSAWGTEELYVQEYLFNPYGLGWHLDRRRFDAMLADCAGAAGVKFYRRARISGYSREGNGWRFEFICGREKQTLQTRFLVDATGRASILRRELGGQETKYDQLIGAAAWFTAETLGATLENYTIIEAAEQGWWYWAPLPDGQVVVLYMTDLDLYKRGRQDSSQFWHKRLHDTKHIGQRLKGFTPLGLPQAFLADSHLVESLPDEPWLPVGDAVMALDPLSGAGISTALRTAAWAAQTIPAYIDGDHSASSRYLAKIQHSFAAYLKTRQQYYQQETRWHDSVFWQRRQGH